MSKGNDESAIGVAVATGGENTGKLAPDDEEYALL